MKLYMFRTVRLSIIRSLFTVRSAMVYVLQVTNYTTTNNIAIFYILWKNKYFKNCI